MATIAMIAINTPSTPMPIRSFRGPISLLMS